MPSKKETKRGPAKVKDLPNVKRKLTAKNMKDVGAVLLTSI